jgi:hypothetical protein
MLAVCRQAGGRQTGWLQADRLRAGRQTGCLLADWRQADWLAACSIAGSRRQVYWLAACKRGPGNMLAACRQGGGRQKVNGQAGRSSDWLPLWNVLTSILKTIGAPTESSKFHIIEFEKYLFRDRNYFCVQVCSRERKVAN